MRSCYLLSSTCKLETSTALTQFQFVYTLDIISKIIAYLKEPSSKLQRLHEDLILQKQLHQVSNQGNLFKELTSEKYFSVIVCPIFRLAVILMMFIKHGSSNYVAWHSSATLDPQLQTCCSKTLRNIIPSNSVEE